MRHTAGLWPSQAWRLTPEAAPGTTLQTDIPSGRLIIARVDDPLEFRGAPEISVDRGFKSLRPHYMYYVF